MKILVVSDSHGRLDYLMEIWKKETPDIVLSAGDYSEDVEELSYIHENSKYFIVRGNCDFMDHTNDDNLELELGDKKIFLTHGHLYGVKSSYHYLRLEAEERDANLCIFGHTHIPYLEDGELILFNPGAVKDKEYGVIEISKNKMTLEHRTL